MRSELELVLAHLQRSTNMGRFLAYVCEEYFNGRADRLKEYNIAVEALGRPDSFQPGQDPIVRVHAMRLRQHLADYYRAVGSEHRIRIKLPKGGYVPEFEVVDTRLQPTRPEIANSDTDSSKEEPVLPQDDIERPRTSSFWQTWPYVVGVLALVLCVLSLVAWALRSRRDSRSLSTYTNMGPVGVSAPSQEEIRILAGNSVVSYIDKLGRVWSGDRYYTGGEGWRVGAEPFSRVYDPNLWKYRRAGVSFRYDIPLKPGTYELHLFFTEDEFGIKDDPGGGEGTRVFDVFVNDNRVLVEFDVIRDAGGARTGDERVFLVSPARDGLLHLRFDARVQRAILSGIEIVPALDNRMRPIRIATRINPYISNGHVTWRPDQYYFGGHQHEVQNPVIAEDPELYSTERFGNFSYTIPVAPGSYTAILHFSETYFGTGVVGKGAGDRVFDVYFNGAAILKDFDIYKSAGGANRVVRKEFHGLRPDALGKLVFTFHPNRNNPSINALEIIPED